MDSNKLLREYRRHRAIHFQPPYRESRAPASGALRCAREALLIAEREESQDPDGTRYFGNIRLRIVPDECQLFEDMAGDTFNVELNKDTVPGGERTIKAEEKRYLELLNREGVWGFIIERRCESCGQWQHVDSCFGFEGPPDGKYFEMRYTSALASVLSTPNTVITIGQ